jgi:ribose transport system ATP-binding protein
MPRTERNSQNHSAEVHNNSASVDSSVVPILDMKNIVKRFPGVVALDHVELCVFRGEVHSLFGENGSGKSTLVNVIAGTYPRDSGVFVYRGKKIRQWSSYMARSAGISSVFQEFSLVSEMTVEENLFLGRELRDGIILRKKEMRHLGERILADLGFNLNLKSRVKVLSRADQQMTEIAKALLQDVKLLILDEPTASLTNKETEKLFEAVKRLQIRGVGIIYVSHRIAEIRELADRITVLRDGKRIGSVKTTDISDNELVEMMTGRAIDMLFPVVHQRPGAVILKVKNLSIKGRLNNVNLYLREGEIAGIAGLAGGGKSEITRAIFGLEEISNGEIVYNGEQIAHLKPAEMLARGIFYLPSNRMAEGLSLPRPVRENATMACLDLPAFSRYKILRRSNEQAEVTRTMKRLQIRPEKTELAVRYLSGGNQQKVLLLRGLLRDSKLFLLDDPTVGIDVGAKIEVYLFLKSLCENGAAILFISSELMEVLNLCNRVYVAHRGHLVAEYAGTNITERNLLASFFGVDAKVPTGASQENGR